MRPGDFSEADFQRALRRNIRALTRAKTPPHSPEAILLGGQSGAGKTIIHRIKQKEFFGNIIIIDGDSYRYQHPSYSSLQARYGKECVTYTRKFSGKMVERLIDELSLSGYHLLIEGTLRTEKIPRRTAQLLKSRGYRVSLALIATKPELSWLATRIRYEELYSINPGRARATPKAHHDAIVSHLVDNLRRLEAENLFDRIQIYQRDKTCVYDSDAAESDNSEVTGSAVPGGGGSHIADSPAAAKMQEILFGKWTPAEKEILRQGEIQLRELRERNDHF